MSAHPAGSELFKQFSLLTVLDARQEALRVRRGEVFENPVTGERVTLITNPFEHPAGITVAELRLRPGARVSVAHRHPQMVERFHVVRGSVTYLIDGIEATLGPGQAAEVRAGTVHDWWQVGDAEAVVVVQTEPGMRFAEMLTTFFGLAREGKVDRRGVPHLLQLALTARAYRDVMVVASPPEWLQRVLFSLLAPLARLRGLKPMYPQYLDSPITADPDPDALAVVGADGRLRFDGQHSNS